MTPHKIPSLFPYIPPTLKWKFLKIFSGIIQNIFPDPEFYWCSFVISWNWQSTKYTHCTQKNFYVTKIKSPILKLSSYLLFTTENNFKNILMKFSVVPPQELFLITLYIFYKHCGCLVGKQNNFVVILCHYIILKIRWIFTI